MRAILLIWLLLLSARSPAQLVPVDALPSTPFYSLAARGDTLFAGADARLWISPDRGTTWQATSRVDADARSIDAIAVTDAGWFVSSFDYGVFRSLDQGTTWTPLNAGLVGIGARVVTDLEVWNTNLYAATDGAGVFVLDLQTLDRWQPFGDEFAQNEAETVASLTRVDDVLIAGAGGNGLIFARDLRAGPWRTAAVLGHVIGVAATEAGLLAATPRWVYVSTDHGTTWTPTGPIPFARLYLTIATVGHPRDDGTAYISATLDAGLSRLYRSADLSAAWEDLGPIPETLALLTYGDRLYLAQSDGLRYLPLPPPTAVEPIGAPPAFDLSPPTPHPVTGPATFTIRLGRIGPVRLDVFDALGRHIERLYDGPATSRPLVVRWEAESVPAGLYVVRLTGANGLAVRPVVIIR